MLKIVYLKPENKSYLVVEAWAMTLPPTGFLGSALNMVAAPSTVATTWFVITTATPNCKKRVFQTSNLNTVSSKMTTHFVGQAHQEAQKAGQVHLARCQLAATVVVRAVQVGRAVHNEQRVARPAAGLQREIVDFSQTPIFD